MDYVIRKLITHLEKKKKTFELHYPEANSGSRKRLSDYVIWNIKKRYF